MTLNIYIYIDNVSGPLLFSLHKGDDPKEALTNSSVSNLPGGSTNQTPLTREELELCATQGLMLLDFATYSPIWVARNPLINDGFDLLSYGKSAPNAEYPSVMTITISVSEPNEEGVSTYNVEKDGKRETIVTDAPSDGKVYGRKDGTWNEVEGITELSFDRPHDVIMSSMLDSITTPGVYKIKSPNYYCEGCLEVVNVNMADGYERLLKQILRISEKGKGGGSTSLTGEVVDIPYAYRYRFASSMSNWTNWVKSNSDTNLGELSGSYDNPFSSEFDNIMDEGEYRFTLPNYYGSGILRVYKIRNTITDNYSIQQVLYMDVTQYDGIYPDFIAGITSMIYAVRSFDGYWSSWKKFTQTLE